MGGYLRHLLVELATAAQGRLSPLGVVAHALIDPPAAGLAPIRLLSRALAQIDAYATAKNTREAQEAAAEAPAELCSPDGIGLHSLQPM